MNSSSTNADGGRASGAPDNGARAGVRGRLRRLFVATEHNAVVAAAPLVPLVRIFRWAWPYIRPYRRYVAMSVVLSICLPLVEAARLYMIKVTIDNVLIPEDYSQFPWVAGAMVGLTLVYAAASYFDAMLGIWVGQRFILSMRTDFFRHLQNLSLDFFERRRLGDILARLTGDIRAIESLVLAGLNKGLASIFKVAIFAGMLFFLDWQLALVVLMITPIFGLLVRFLTRQVKRASREKQRRTGSLTALAEESLSNVALVQAYNRQQFEVERFHEENEGAFAATMTVSRAKALVPSIVDVVQGISAVAVLGLGVLAIRDGRLSVGGLLVFIAYLSQLYAPVRQLAVQYNTVAGAAAGAERVIEHFDHRPTVVEAADATPLPRATGLIEFDSVTFQYPGTERDALEDVSFSIEPGEIIALVGESGAGKTTLTKLLLRFYDVSGGAIRVDGRDLRELQIESLRDNIAVLMQETLIFEGSIRENIRYGRPGASDEDVVQAAKAADAHGFISGLPEGYETLVGQKGRRLSGGQRQRIAIARAMIREAPILILDEPTTGLDAESGERIMEPLDKLMSTRTTIVISHSLVTAMRADRIVVVEHGQVVEEGSPDVLATQGGPFARIRRLHEAGIASASGS